LNEAGHLADIRNPREADALGKGCWRADCHANGTPLTSCPRTPTFAATVSWSPLYVKNGGSRRREGSLATTRRRDGRLGMMSTGATGTCVHAARQGAWRDLVVRAATRAPKHALQGTDGHRS